MIAKGGGPWGLLAKAFGWQVAALAIALVALILVAIIVAVHDGRVVQGGVTWTPSKAGEGLLAISLGQLATIWLAV